MIPVSERQWTRRGRSRIPTFKTVLGCEGGDETYVRLKQKERKKRKKRKDHLLQLVDHIRHYFRHLEAIWLISDHTFGILTMTHGKE